MPAFLAVAISFAVQGDWVIAFCRLLFFFPGPKACLICRFFFPRFLFLFLPFSSFFSIVLFVLRSSFLSFPFLIIKMFQFSDNLAITFCWKRDLGGGIDSFDPNKKKGSTKKWTGSQHYVTALYWNLESLMHFFIATNASWLEPLVFIKYCLSSSEMRS